MDNLKLAGYDREKKKILFIITYLELGGAQKQLLYILKTLNKQKYSVYLYAGDKGYLKKDFLNISEVNIRLDPWLRREIAFFFDIVAFFRLFSFIKKHKFDIVHTHSPKASILGRWAAYLSGVRNIIYTVHGWPFHKFMNRLLHSFYLFLERMTAKITKKIIVVSRADLNIGIDQKIGSSDKFILVHYGVDIDLLESIFLKRKNYFPCSDLIVSISSLKPQKGLRDFLEMTKLILPIRNGSKFFIVGDGPLKRSLQRTIREFGLESRVFLKGWVKDISSVFTKTSLLVLTSLWEGLPLAIIEATIAGVPVIVTDTGGTRDILENYKNGIVVKPKEVARLAQAVNEILDNYDEWSRMVKTQREKLDLSYWSQERMIKEIESIYAIS